VDQPPEAANVTPPVGALSTVHSTSRPAFFRTVANLGIQAAEALEHAHQLGVIHRDIKPANLMVEGEPGALATGVRLWITDFGLAHCQSQAGLTMSGDLVGTLRYMSPEQALAKRVLVDHRTDIYSLGVTLYELLTLEPVFPGKDRQELLHQIASEDPKPLRRLNKAIPAELEIIVLKALDKNPDDRYATAQELAADLERFLKDEPIRAKRPGLVQRVKKWGRRHKPVVRSMVMLLVMALLGLALGIVLILQEKNRTQTAYDRMKENLLLSFKALDEIYIKVTSERLPRDPKRQEEDRQLLEKALHFYEEFANQNSSDPEVWQELVRAYDRVGSIYHRLGRHEEAEIAFRNGLAIAEKQASDFRSNPDRQSNLSAIHYHLSKLLMDLGRAQEASDALRNSLTIDERLAEEYPLKPQYRASLAKTYDALAIHLHPVGQSQDAENSFLRAEKLWKNLAAEDPANRLSLAVCQRLLAVLLEQTGRGEEAKQKGSEAVALQQKLVAEVPTEPSYRYELAQGYINLGMIMTNADRNPDGEQNFRDAIKLLEKLAADFPSVPGYRRDLAKGYNNLGAVLGYMKQYREAEKAHRQALAVREKLVADFPNVPEHQYFLAGGYFNLGTIFFHAGRHDDAEQMFHKALPLHQKLATQFPDLADYQSSLGSDLVYLGRNLLKQDQPDKARPYLEQAIRQQQAALKLNPRHPTYRVFLGMAYGNLAEALVRLRVHAEAVAMAEQLHSLLPDNSDDTYDTACLLARCVPLAETDSKLPADKRAELARTYSDRAIELLHRAVEKGYKDFDNMRKDTDLDPIRGHPGFQELLATNRAKPAVENVPQP
jgi:serine/threonine protein kinase